MNAWRPLLPTSLCRHCRRPSFLHFCFAGMACDPVTGEVIPCTPGYVRSPSKIFRYDMSRSPMLHVCLCARRRCRYLNLDLYSPLCARRGQSAKEISVLILEQADAPPFCTRVEHANYLGREFQRAEFALVTGGDYIQD